VTEIEQLHGPVLLGIICLLIFIEECGVPLPFAPGDLLLAVCGLAIHNGSLHPVLGLAAVYLTTIGGAMAGREIFARVGAPLLRRLTGSTRLQGPLERAAALLNRGGSAAVLAGRITPGLRIHTNQVSGLLGLPRRTFLLGLAPGAGIYVAVFAGAGMLFGRQAMELLHHAVHKLGLGVTVALVVLLWVGVAWLGTRMLRERRVASAPERQGGPPR
jgi:membrane protein DedA with SNARE-associated domain